MKKSWLRRFFFTTDSRGADKLSWRVPVLGGVLAILGIYIAIHSGGPLASMLTGAPDKKAYEGTHQLIQRQETDESLKRGVSTDILDQEHRQTQIAKDNASNARPDTNIDPRLETEQKANDERNNAADIPDRLQNVLNESKKKAEAPPAPVTTATEIDTSEDDWVPSYMRKENAKNGSNSGGGSAQGGAIVLPTPKDSPDTVAANQPPKPKDTSGMFDPSEGPQNILPMGTFIACDLDQDVRSDSLSSYVWCTVVIDSTFRRQLQLPLGLARARGKVATQPVGDKVDIAFDVLQFSDGTEVPISGNAYTPFDLSAPDRFKERGIIGVLHTPPLYIELEGDLLAGIQGGLGGSGSTSTVNSTFGSFSTTSNKSFLQGAGDSVASRLLDHADKMLATYQPYVTLEKGQPFFIQLDNDVDLNKRAVNGFATAQEKARLAKIGELNALNVPGAQIANMVGGGNAGSTSTVPGDARYVAPVATYQAQTTTQNQTPNYAAMGNNIQYAPPYPASTVQTTTATGNPHVVVGPANQ